MLNLIPLAKVPDTAEVWVCEPLDIISEFRVYVHDGDILGVKHYYGEWDVVPRKNEVERVVKAYKPCPITYGIDFAVSRVKNEAYDSSHGLYSRNAPYYDETIVLEVNDGCNLGNCGLDSIHYGEMIVARWFEIVGKKDLRSALGNQMVDGIRRQLQADIQGRTAEGLVQAGLYR